MRQNTLALPLKSTSREVQYLDGGVAADAPELLAHVGQVLHPVVVGVDNRVGQARVKLPGSV